MRVEAGVHRSMSGDKIEREEVARAIRAYMARERISGDQFVHRTKLGKSTVDKLLTGLFSEKTLQRVETTLDHDFHPTRAIPTVAPEHYGKYSREDVQRYLGTYIFVRPCFMGEPVLYAFNMQIIWDDAVPALVVQEKESGELPAQIGHIFIPRSSMHLFIHCNESGWLKQVILSQLDHHNKMKGVMLTMGDVFANVYMPVAIPVIMNKCEDITDGMAGRIIQGSTHYQAYHTDLNAIEAEKFAKWVSLPPLGNTVNAAHTRARKK